MTESEMLFERFCRERGITFKRLEEAATRTPDYEMGLATLRAAVEVKQLEPNTQDRKLLSELRQTGAMSHWVNMQRPRQAILDATRQLRAHGRGVMPSIALLFDMAGGLLGYLGAASIAQSLYGARLVHLADVPGRQLEVLGASFGGRRVATEKHNTSLSAVAVLRLFQNDVLSLTMFHNRYAAIPLDPSELRARNVEHFAWTQDTAAVLPRWSRV
jgi:hypothetical protein